MSPNSEQPTSTDIEETVRAFLADHHPRGRRGIDRIAPTDNLWRVVDSLNLLLLVEYIEAKFGKEGGKARAKNMTAQQRADAARKAVEARWAKRRKLVDEITEKSKQLLEITVKRETAMLGQTKANARRTKQKKRKPF